MKNIRKLNLFCLVAALTLSTVTYGDIDMATSDPSNEFMLNAGIENQPFFFQDSEPIYYSGKFQSYDEASAKTLRVTETTDDVTTVLKEATPADAGSFELRPADYSIGYHLLKHEILDTSGKVLASMQKGFTILDMEKVEFHVGQLSKNETWSTNKVHIIYESFVIPSGRTLTIAYGAIVKFCTGASIDIASGASCIANGTIFTHINDDTIGGDTLNDGIKSSPMDAYSINGNLTYNDETAFRFLSEQQIELSGTISQNTKLNRNKTYCVSSVTINGCTLTIPAGTVLKMNSGASITVNSGATLSAMGTRAAPIIITSIKDDSYNGDTNSDGDATHPYAGDWGTINCSGGNIKMEYVSVLYGGNPSDVFNMTGGSISFNNCILAHAYQYGVALESGSWSMTNSMFVDYQIAFRHFASCNCINSVFYGMTYLSNNGGQTFKNCVISNFGTSLCWWSDSCTYNNCVIWNPPGFGPQSSDRTGSNGNIWGDPLFIDPENNDFRILENSPCVDAADSDVAPDYDYYGQPRVTITAGHSGDKPAADIGIFEVMPSDIKGDKDLIPLGVNSDTNAVPGKTIFIEWQIKNCGTNEVNGTWRDTISLVTSYGHEIILGERTITSRIPGGSILSCAGNFIVPVLGEGIWYPKVNVNSYHDIFEGILSTNNALIGQKPIDITLESADPNSPGEGTIDPGVPTIIKLNYGETNANRMVRFTVPAGVRISWGFGFVPSESYYSGSTVSGEQDVVFLIPEGATDVYVVLESDQSAAYNYSADSSVMTISSVSPATLPSSGTTTLTIVGGGFGEKNKVTLFNSDESVDLGEYSVDSSGRIFATVNCFLLKAGTTYSLKVSSNESSAALPGAITVTGVSPFVNLVATLETPDSVRQGRTTVVYINYENKGNIDLPAPIFELISDGQIFSVDEMKYTNTVKVVGLSKDAPVGMLRPNKPQRVGVAVTIMSSSVRWSLRAYHAGQESAKKTRFSLGELYDDDWVIYHDPEDDELISQLRSAVGTTWADFYTNFGLWLNVLESIDMDFETLKCSFAEYQYLKATGQFDDNFDEDDSEKYTDCNHDFNSNKAILSDKTIISSNHHHDGIPDYEWRKGVSYDGGDGTIWKWCDTCGCFYLAISKSLINDEFEYFAFEDIDLSKNTYIICHGNNNTIEEKWIAEMAEALQARDEDSNVLAINWGIGANQGLPWDSAEWIPMVVDEAIGYLDHLGIIPSKTTLIGHSHGGHVAANIILRYLNKSGFEKFNRFVGLDVSTTDNWTHKWNIYKPSLWIEFINNYCKQTEFYKSSWDMSLEERSELYGHYNFVLIDGKHKFYEAKKLGFIYEYVKTGRHNYSYQWFTKTIYSKNLYKNLGFNFNAEEDISWVDIAGKEIVPPRGEKCFAGVIFKNKLELLSSRNNRSPWRYRETVISNPLSVPQSYESKSMRVCYWAWFNTADIEINAQIPNNIYSGDRINVHLSNNADNLSIDYNKVLNVKIPIPSLNKYINFYKALNFVYDFSEKAAINEIISKYHGTITAWIVDLDGLGVNTKITTISELQDAFKKVSRPEQYYRKLDSTECGNFPKPGGSNVSTSLKINIDDHIFGSDTSLVNDERKVLLVLSSGNIYDLHTMYAPTWDLYYQNNYILKEVKVKKATSVSAKISRWFGFGYAVIKSNNIVNDSNRQELKDNQIVRINASSDGSWSVKLDSLSSTAKGAQITISEFSILDAENKKGSVSLSDANYDIWNTMVVGRLPSDTDGDGNLVCEGERYTVQLRVATEYGEDITKCILDVRAPKNPDDGEDKDDKGSFVPQPGDPNEIKGPIGLGDPDTERFVKPGELMTYTIYFENKPEATAAAQEVYVRNPLSEYLDWSTFRMNEIVFNNQIDLGLSGKRSGTCEATMNGTNYIVRTVLNLDLNKGEANWYMRIVDDTTDTGWPSDVYAGFLPPNDETHCGEGHLTYSIKVRDDVPSNVTIANSATIIFDYNEPMETDPAWWNKIAKFQSISFEGCDTNITLIVGLPYGELPTIGDREGWTFVGWFTGPNGTGRHITSDSLVEEGDDKLYAYWTANAYTVNYHANGGEGEMESQNVTYGMVFNLSSNKFINASYRHAGWAKSETGDVVYKDGATVSNLTVIAGGEVDLFAVWKSWTVQISIDIDGTETNLNLIVGQPYGELPKPVERKGWTFVGWFTGPDGTGRSITSDTLVEDSDEKLYAYWTVNTYTVNYFANGGDGEMESQNVTYGMVFNLSSNVFIRNNYKFTGWGTNETGNVVYNDGAIVSNLTAVAGGEVDLFAVWKSMSVQIRIIIDGTETNLNLVIGLPCGELPMPSERKGWVFVGWFTGPDGTGRQINSDTIVEIDDEVLYQYWVRKTHELIEDEDGDSSAGQYDGYIYDSDNRGIIGLIRAKIAKPKGGKTGVSVTITIAGGEKTDASGEMDVSTGHMEATAKNGKSVKLDFAANDLSGAYGSYSIDGARNIFVSRAGNDKATADNALAIWGGTHTVMWEDNFGYATASVAIGAKGKVKVVGWNGMGTKFSADGQFIVGDKENCAVIVSKSRNVPVAFNIWFSTNNGNEAEGIGDNSVTAKAGQLVSDAVFMCDYLNENVLVLIQNGKWVVNTGKDTAFKLSYKGKTGIFKGSFKAQGQKAIINGVVVDGVGYGSAVIKNSGFKSVIINRVNE